MLHFQNYEINADDSFVCWYHVLLCGKYKIILCIHSQSKVDANSLSAKEFELSGVQINMVLFNITPASRLEPLLFSLSVVLFLINQAFYKPLELSGGSYN